MNKGDIVPLTLEGVSPEQLGLYARELQGHVHEERRLRQQLEERNRDLEQRVRELTALNKLFQQHLNERFAVVEACRRVLESLDLLAHEADALKEFAGSALLPEVREGSETAAS